MRRSFYVLIAWMMAVSLQAQNRLSGKIADESGQALPVVTVRVLTTDSTFVKGTVTNDEGAYSFESISPGSYMLAISSVGYISQYVNFSMPASDLSMPLVTLQSDEIMLQSIEVKGTAFIRKKDYLMVIPDKQQVKHAYTGYDLLYNLMIPGVNVDRREGIVSTPRGSATLYINGVRADFREVQNLRPKDIERIEYYDIPTGEYQGDVASVNYVTKTYKSGGYVSVDGEQNIGYLKGKYNIGAKLVHENTSYTFFGGHSMTDYDGIETMKEENISLTDYGVKRNTSHEDAQYQNNQQYAQFKINNVTPKRNLSGLVSLVRDRTPHDDITENLSYIGYNDRQLRSVEGGSQQSLKPSIGLNGIFTPTENQRIRIQLNGSYTRNKYNRSYQEEEQSSFTRVGEDLYSFSMIGIYNIRLKHKNSFGGNIQHYHNITSSSYTGDYDSWQHLWMGEIILFLNYTQDIGDKLTIMVSPGGSLLNYRLHGNGLECYWTFRTNSWFRYRFNASHWLAAGYARGNNQVSLSYLNTTDQTIDFLQIKRGNPSLDNPKVSDFFFNYGGKLGAVNLQLDVTHTTYSHNVSPDYYVENNKLVSSYRSNTSYHWLKTDLFSFLFNKVCMVIVSMLAVGLNICFFCSAQSLFVFNNKVDVYTVIGLFIFMVASSFFHELGHASACKYFSIRHGGIGLGLYLNFPVLYTDVTEVWKLSRGKCCVVNIAGVYFQGFALIGLLIGYLLTNNDILRYLILIMNLGFLMTLNPFFKFDGYWIASDLLGVPNLRKRSKELVSYLYKRIRWKPVIEVPYLLQIRPVEKYCLLVYSVLVNLFMGYYFVYIIPRFLYRFVQSFPDEVEQLVLYLSNNITPPFALLRNIGMQLLFLALIGMMVFKLVQPLVAKYGKRK